MSILIEGQHNYTADILYAAMKEQGINDIDVIIDNGYITLDSALEIPLHYMNVINNLIDILDNQYKR